MEIKLLEKNNELIAGLSGHFSFQDREIFETIIEKADATKPRHFQLNLSQLNSIDSSGLGMLVILYKKTAAQGTQVVLNTPSKAVKKALDLAKFELLFKIIEA